MDTLNKSPFLLEGKNNTAILFIHGLLDSPFQMRDMAIVMNKAGYTTKAICLAGHGACPDDLLYADADVWLQEARSALQLLSVDFDNIVIIGFSTGAAIGLRLAEHFPKVSHLIALSPFIQLKSYLRFTLKLHELLMPIVPRMKWLIKMKDTDPSKYKSIATRGALEAQEIAKSNEHLDLKIPVMFIHSVNDALMSLTATLDFFERQENKKDLFLLYAKKNIPDLPKGVETILTEKALPHHCLSISPENTFLGKHGSIKTNELRYNPFFEEMMKKVMTWLI